MSIAPLVTRYELQRQAAAAFEGKGFKVFLARSNGSVGVESTVAAWEALERSGNGYAAVTGTIGTGTWNAGISKYVLPTINAQFTGTGAGYEYDAVIVKITGATYPHSVNLLDAPFTLQSGQSKSYPVTLRVGR